MHESNTIGNEIPSRDYYAASVPAIEPLPYAEWMGEKAAPSWAPRLRAHMKREGVTQEQVAGAMDVTQGAVAHWLSGRREIGLTEFFELCAVTHADPKFVLFGPPHQTEGEIKLEQLLREHPELASRIAANAAPDARVEKALGRAPREKRFRRYPSPARRRRIAT